jgi:uncharacterized protein YndB with AHSA1/START domain
MASIHKEMLIAAPVERVWAAVRDIGDIHTRFARGFVVDTRVEGTSRLVTFANGMVVREQIVDIDERRRRLAYSIVDWQLTHHNASFQVFPDGPGRSRLVWIADLLPNELADLVGGFMQQGCAAITRTLEQAD